MQPIKTRGAHISHTQQTLQLCIYEIHNKDANRASKRIGSHAATSPRPPAKATPQSRNSAIYRLVLHTFILFKSHQISASASSSTHAGNAVGPPRKTYPSGSLFYPSHHQRNRITSASYWHIPLSHHAIIKAHLQAIPSSGICILDTVFRHVSCKNSETRGGQKFRNHTRKNFETRGGYIRKNFQTRPVYRPQKF